MHSSKPSQNRILHIEDRFLVRTILLGNEADVNLRYLEGSVCALDFSFIQHDCSLHLICLPRKAHVGGSAVKEETVILALHRGSQIAVPF